MVIIMSMIYNVTQKTIMNSNIGYNIWDVFNTLVRVPLALEGHNFMFAIMLMIFLDFLRFYHIAYSPQEKRSVLLIISMRCINCLTSFSTT